MSWSGAFDFLFCPAGRVFVHGDCPGEGFFAPFAVTSERLSNRYSYSIETIIFIIF